ncbi:hypothetical protein [Amycolatopsis sp. NPDC051372]
MAHQAREHRSIPGLTETDESHQRPAAPVEQVMDLRASATTGAAIA